MPILKNARCEIFALAIARGESAHRAYTLADYKQHRQNAARLMTNDAIKASVRYRRRCDSLTSKGTRTWLRVQCIDSAQVVDSSGKALLHQLRLIFILALG